MAGCKHSWNTFLEGAGEGEREGASRREGRAAELPGERVQVTDILLASVTCHVLASS